MKPIDPVFEALCERMGIAGHELMPVLREHMDMHCASVSSAHAALDMSKKAFWEDHARLSFVRGTLQRIAQNDYGLQGLHEDDAPADEIERYLAEQSSWRRVAAIEALDVLDGKVTTKDVQS